MSHIGMICERIKHALNDKTKTNQINFEKTKICFFFGFLKMFNNFAHSNQQILYAKL